MHTPLRQGDVILIPVDEVPAGLVPFDRDEAGRLVLAIGETTGHAHAILDPAAELFRQADLDEMADRFLRVTEEVVLGHVDTLRSDKRADHDSVTLPAGDYVVRIKREYTPERIQYVYD